jgi:hypothetical protein
MDRARLQEQSEALAAAIAEEPRDIQAYWVRRFLQALEAEAGEGYAVTLTEIRAEIDARVVLGNWD